MFELTETQLRLQETARSFANKEIAPRAARIDQTEEYPWENVKFPADHFFLSKGRRNFPV